MFYLGGGHGVLLFCRHCCCRCWGSFLPFAGAVWGEGGEGGGRAEETPYRCTGHLCREPRAGVEAAFVFSVSWCLQMTLTTVEVYFVVSVYLNYLISC